MGMGMRSRVGRQKSVKASTIRSWRRGLGYRYKATFHLASELQTSFPFPPMATYGALDFLIVQQFLPIRSSVT